MSGILQWPLLKDKKEKRTDSKSRHPLFSGKEEMLRNMGVPILFRPCQITVSIPPIFAVESSRLWESIQTAVRRVDDDIGSILSKIGYADF